MLGLGSLLTVLLLGSSSLPSLLAANSLADAIREYDSFFLRAHGEALQSGGTVVDLIKEVSDKMNMNLAGDIFNTQETIDAQMTEFAEGKLAEPGAFLRYLTDT